MCSVSICITEFQLVYILLKFPNSFTLLQTSCMTWNKTFHCTSIIFHKIEIITQAFYVWIIHARKAQSEVLRGRQSCRDYFNNVSENVLLKNNFSGLFSSKTCILNNPHKTKCALRNEENHYPLPSPNCPCFFWRCTGMSLSLYWAFSPLSSSSWGHQSKKK